jgi:hypothetical protein
MAMSKPSTPSWTRRAALGLAFAAALSTGGCSDDPNTPKESGRVWLHPPEAPHVLARVKQPDSS